MTSKSRGELYRNTSQGKLAGVCAGIADYFGWESWLVRILVVSGVLLGMGWFIVIYIAAWFILDKKPINLGHTHRNGQRGDFGHGQANQHSKQQVPGQQGFDEDITNESIKVKSRIWQAGEPPKQAFHDIRRKFKTLELELQVIERYVTSPEFTVSREINQL
ncbi:envelope stress response membrane protein PspC [Colwellia sp. C1TZA3]|uniref:envelope stress response membrane protein PspC n=1 Tax=Colwellia sp. C1TZA3 TaxID=2508879 RepID=UPI0011B988D6|nr:envelope stress response membrane protein PspC [Colwellia sp. C1TZA3]TWX73280.1 envelope stress response membrane protein PspC [Colwellia sp. C1TZA3]